MIARLDEELQESFLFQSNQFGQSGGVQNVVWTVLRLCDDNQQLQIKDQDWSSSKRNTFRWVQEISPSGRMEKSNFSKNLIKIHTGPVPDTLWNLSVETWRVTQWFQTERRSCFEVELK